MYKYLNKVHRACALFSHIFLKRFKAHFTVFLLSRNMCYNEYIHISTK